MENEEQNISFDDIYSSEEETEQKETKSKNLVDGEEFRTLQKKAKRHGARSLDYSKRKDKKYVVVTKSGKKIHFGSTRYEDYLSHKDDERREKYLKRAKGIKNKEGEITYKNPESANYWSINLLW